MTVNDKTSLSTIKSLIDDLLIKKENVIIGIDGMAASGKTTLAERLKEQYSALVINIDDFFLQDYQKTDKRLSEVDGFIDYERFEEEVINPLKKKVFTKYYQYNCQTKEMIERIIKDEYQVYIIEGAYSLRDSFIDIYDLKILKLINEKEQISRISKRNPSHLVKRFIEEWVPRENQYIKEYDLINSVDLIIKD